MHRTNPDPGLIFQIVRALLGHLCSTTDNNIAAHLVWRRTLSRVRAPEGRGAGDTESGRRITSPVGVPPPPLFKAPHCQVRSLPLWFSVDERPGESAKCSAAVRRSSRRAPTRTAPIL
ncbi:unnamed protein product [Arctogadus glacialis]